MQRTLQNCFDFVSREYQRQKRFGLGHRFKVCTVARYIGGFIADDKSKRDCLKEPTETWEWNIHMISKTVVKYLQEIYSAVVYAIQPDWIFLQHITDNTIYEFAGVENMIWEDFVSREYQRQKRFGLGVS